jgi:hypothetical protein
MFVGISAGDVQGPSGVTAASYRIPPGSVDVLQLGPNQKAYAAADGPGVQCCIWQSADCGYTV